MTHHTVAERPPHDEADKLLSYALTICMYGERAPGGDENWQTFARDAEDYLRRRTCWQAGGHAPQDPGCRDCAQAKRRAAKQAEARLIEGEQRG